MEQRICPICKQPHSTKAGFRADGSVYIARRCYPCSQSKPGFRTKEERFFEKINKTSFGCWEWTAATRKDGYGVFGVATSKSMLAHRYSYALHYGSFKKSLLVCHKCDNPKCVNPEHLFLGTHQDNMDDMREKGRRKTLRGEDSPNCKITEDDVRAIRKDTDSCRKIAEKYNVSAGLISHIKTRRQWKHVK